MKKAVDTKWFEIVWDKRKKVFETSGNEYTLLQKLILTNGFDSPLGMMKESDWREFVDIAIKKTGLEKGDSIFEVGCGSGAFLYPLYEQGHEVAGIDFAPGQIDVARVAMPDRKEFLHSIEAIDISVKPRYDLVTTNQVIHFFPSLDYAEEAIGKMLDKAIKTVFVAGVPDLALKEESEETRRSIIGREKYEEMYEGLENLYYSKTWFEEMADEKGFSITFSSHQMPGFAQNRFRFDAVLHRI
jgi:SAM-dependent methyltransferase